MSRLRGLVQRLHGERSQGLTEFAILAPLLLLVLFGIVDFGRGIYYYVALQESVNEGARVAVRAPQPPTDSVTTSDQSILAAMKTAVPTIPQMQLDPLCPNGPIDSNTPPGGTAYVYITQPNGTTTPPAANAPEGGQGSGTTQSGTNCNAIAEAGYNGQNNVPLQVEVRYDFTPITPLISQVVGTKIVMTAWAAYRTEY